MTTDWSRLVRPSLLGLEPYRPGASLEELRAAYGLDEIVKLNWNEGLQGPFPGVAEAVHEELARIWIYPEQAYSDLRESVAGWIG
ncbi:MAG: histidinol-phosphate transaminase, partial [Gaiellaceae bacterium]